MKNNEIVERDSKKREKMKFVSKTCIQIDRILSNLDKFAIDFVTVLKKHTKYVIVSGYVSILLGRSRATEDIDIIIPEIGLAKLKSLLKDLKENGFYCINAEKDEDIYKNLREGISARFAKKEKVIPNIELKQSKNRFDDLSLSKKIVIKLPETELFVSNLELQIAYKEAVLKSPKDREDARHIKRIAKEYIDNKLIQSYKEQLNEFYFKTKQKR